MHWKVRENQMVFLEAKQQQTKARWMVTMVQTGREAAALHSALILTFCLNYSYRTNTCISIILLSIFCQYYNNYCTGMAIPWTDMMFCLISKSYHPVDPWHQMNRWTSWEPLRMKCYKPQACPQKEMNRFEIPFVTLPFSNVLWNLH